MGLLRRKIKIIRKKTPAGIVYFEGFITFVTLNASVILLTLNNCSK